jgi:hypothetical protein
LHLYVRAAAAGYEIPIQRLFATSNLYQTEAVHYLPLVLPEALRLKDLSFTEIEATDPPEAFLLQWRADLDTYQHFQNVRTRQEDCNEPDLFILGV